MKKIMFLSAINTQLARMPALGIIAAMVFTVACGGGTGSTATCTVMDENVSVQLISAFSNLVFNQPVALLQNPVSPGRWYVVEQSGRVLTMVNTGALSAEVFIDISDRLSVGPEGGLLGMVFHPDFFSNGIFYLSYTGPGQPLTSHIASYTSTDEGVTADPITEQILISLDQPFGNHNGGHIAFGPIDGNLYIGFGDGGSGGDPDGNAQNTETLLGALLRINVDGAAPYSIPNDNPFAASPGCGNGNNCPEIFAWGFRNPWRFSFDSSNGRLWLGDVGQSAREEVNIVENGANYGWNILEGTKCFSGSSCDTSGLAPPVVDYGRQEGTSITGGYVYRGSDIVNLFGDYIYGDFGSGRIWRFRSANQEDFCPQVLLETGLNIASFTQNDTGEIFVVSYSDGRIYRLSSLNP